jgi:hypothetical protein
MGNARVTWILITYLPHLDPISTFEVLHRCVFPTSSIGHENCAWQEETILSILVIHNIVCSQDASANNPSDWLFLTCNRHIIVTLNILILFVPCMHFFAYLHTFHEIRVLLGEICINIIGNSKLHICGLTSIKTTFTAVRLILGAQTAPLSVLLQCYDRCRYSQHFIIFPFYLPAT